jgi:hypothetical protein
MEAGMMFLPSRASASHVVSAAIALFASRAARQAFSRAICSASTLWSITRIEPSPADSGEASLVVNLLTPTTT